MNPLLFSYKSILKKSITLLLAVLLIIVSIYYGQARKLDGNTYIVTGLRFLTHDMENLYGETGSARFGYQPQVSGFYGLFLLLGEKYAYHLWIAFNCLCLWMTYQLFLRKISRNQIYPTILLTICISVFWFIIDESLYIGQMDLILVFCISVFIFYNEKHALLSGIMLGFIVQFKPHLTLMALPLVIHPNFLPINIYRKWVLKDRDSVILTQNNKVLIWSAAMIIVCIGLFMKINKLDWQQYLKLFKIFQESTGNYAFVHCCTSVNNSLRAIIFNLFSDMPQAGRWYPFPYADISNTHNFRIFATSNYTLLYFIYILLVGLAGAILSYIIYINNILKSGKGRNRILFFLCLSSLSTLSPSFWHTHMIYILPVLIYFSVEIMYRKYKLKHWVYNTYFFLFSSIIAINNYYIIGNYLSDLTLLIGVYYIITFHLFFFLLYEIKKDNALPKNIH